MKEILIHRTEGSLRFAFLQAFSPSESHPKADNWYFRYQLSFVGEQPTFPGNFTGNYWHVDGDDMIVIEEFSNEIFDSSAIKSDSDVRRNLVLFDFKRMATAKFSMVSGGYFNVSTMTVGGDVIFQKIYPNMAKEFEVNLRSLEFEPFSS